MDEITLTLSSPMTEEQWDMIADYDFNHTNEITFHTKHGKIVKFVKESAQPERKKGKWTEKHHAYSDEESVIEEWQSCRCSECGRYDTRPYMYYFTEPNYCSWCGAKMKGEEHDL